MNTTAKLRGVRLSAQKGRLVADLIRGKPVEQALNILQFAPKKGAVIIRKVLESAIANAEHNDGADIDELKVTQYSRRARDLSAPLPRPVQGPRREHHEADLQYFPDGRRREKVEWVRRSTRSVSGLR